MKFSSFSLTVLAATAAAIPHRRHAHEHPVRRDIDVVTATNYVVESQMAVLYVDQNGNPVSTSVEAVDVTVAAEPTSDPAVGAAGYGPPGDGWPTSDDQPSQYGPPGGWPAPVPTSSAEDSTSDAPYSAPPQTTQAPPPPSTDSTPDPASASPPQSASPEGDDGDGDVLGYSIAYAPYNADHSCKSESEVNADIDNLQKYDMVRIYGTDCGQVPLIMQAAKRNNMKVFAGIWDVNNAAAEAQLLVDGAKDDWSRIHTVSVGNEVLSNGTSLDALLGGISAARSVLEGAGYDGPITTVEVYSKLWEGGYGALCDAISYVAANCHPYFNANETPENAGNYVRKAAKRLRDDFCDKDVVITESGWPTDGQVNGNAVPSVANQGIALNALRTEYSGDKGNLVLFSAYNDDWKPDNSYGVEHYWGIYGNAPSAR